jgi:subtilisin family serine protease
MRRTLRTWLAAAGLLLAAATASAGQFILHARTSADAETICKRYGLTDVRFLHQQTGADAICVVTANTQSAAEDAELKTLVSADTLTLGFEINSSLALAEAAPTSTSTTGGLAQSTAAILESFAGKAPVPYFSGQVAPGYVTQPAAGLLNLSAAQQVATGAGVIAVIDTGVDPTHPALSSVLVPGYDVVNDVPGVPTDFAEIAQSTAAILEQLGATSPDSVAILNQSTAAILEQSTAAILESAQLPAAFGHGTMVAGLIHLVAPTASIMPIKAFRADGSAEMSDLVSAIYYAVDNGATVINMSFTLVAPSQALQDALAYAASRRVMLVAAVGNDGVQKSLYPASWPGVIAVASTTMNDERSVFSNWGRVDISAPGESLVTAYPGNHYAVVTGTSFATALVSGAVSLVQQYLPRLSEGTALKVFEHGAEVPSYLGEARIDVYKALVYLLHEFN